MEFIGKKVFFLHPHSVLKEEMVKEILMQGYEVYLIHDHEKMLKVLKRYPDSILFINIDEGLHELQWEEYIRKLQNDPLMKEVRIGVLTYNLDKELARKYIMQLNVPCGFTRIKLSYKESENIILKMLEYNEAKGRRHHVRVECDHNYPASFTIKENAELLSGNIRDISVVGMACVFDQNLKFELKETFAEIQLKLHGVLCKVSGVIVAQRDDPGQTNICVIMFSINNFPVSLDRIHDYIYRNLQYNMEQEMKTLE